VTTPPVTAPPATSLPAAPVPAWFTTADCRLEDFRQLIEQETGRADYAYADAVQGNVLIYGERLRGHTGAAGQRRAVQAELARALLEGPGIVVIKEALEAGAVDWATAVFDTLIAEQKGSGAAGGDHFAQPGANDRGWGALDKFALRAPERFADYYANDILALICEAWLGPNYQMTSQLNVVNPGGTAQQVHRDYDLGFMKREQALGYPAQVHLLSPVLTLQGAVAHCDMAPQTQAELLTRAVAGDWHTDRLRTELAAQQARRKAGTA